MPFQRANGILFVGENLDASVAALRERGIAVAMEPETPVRRIAIMHDKDG